MSPIIEKLTRSRDFYKQNNVILVAKQLTDFTSKVIDISDELSDKLLNNPRLTYAPEAIYETGIEFEEPVQSETRIAILESGCSIIDEVICDVDHTIIIFEFPISQLLAT